MLFSVDALNEGNAITVYRLPDELSLDSEISYLQDTMEEALDGARLNALQVTEEQRDMLLKGTSIQVPIRRNTKRESRLPGRPDTGFSLCTRFWC